VKKIGRYDVLKELGRGAMGVVYAAEDPLIGRAVAIKTIRFGTPEAGDDREQLIQRLHREAQAAGVLSHPGIVTVFDVGEQEDEAFIVMEYVEGKSVEDMLAAAELQQPGTFLPILRGTASAIDYAHSKGIIHRDIKPSNIMVCRDGTVKIADFGIAKLTASNSLTRSGFVVGTPSYMSPEQAQGRAVDGRSDQFSLAVVAFLMFTGKLPFEGPTLTALLTKILWDEPEYDSAGMNPAIRPVFKRALSKDPQLRFSTCCDFVRGLEETFAGSESATLAAVPSMTQQGATPAGFNAAPPGSTVAAGLPLGASRFGQGSIPQAASRTTPSWDVQGAGYNKPEAQSPAAVPESATKSRKRKLLLVTWAASLGCIALILIAIFAFKADQKPAASARDRNMETVPASKESADIVNPPSEASNRVTSRERTPVIQLSQIPPESGRNADPMARAPGAPASKIENKKVSVPSVAEPKPVKQDVAPRPASTQPDLNTTPPSETVASGQKKAEKSTAPSQSTSGVLTWSGELERNSILVISEQGSSIGNVVGQFPGKPIKIAVEPKGLLVRQTPGEANRWSQIILYSGNQKYSSIAIRWSIIE
jgi:predicted Ser/Thr protein kinase